MATKIIKTSCPACGVNLEFPADFDNVICAACGSLFQVREYRGAINLSEIERGGDHQGVRPAPNGSGPAQAIELRLAELDEEISGLGSEIEAIKGNEQAAPLQMGCVIFGVFWLVILAMAIFMTVARNYFGGWLFYSALAAVALMGWMRLRRRLIPTSQVIKLREEREGLESVLAELEDERARLLSLKERL
jgi:hypothetical protein